VSSPVQFTAHPDAVVAKVMAAFVDVERRPVQGVITVEELLVHLLDQNEAPVLLGKLNINHRQLQSDALHGLLESRQKTAWDAQDDEGWQAGEFPRRTAEFEGVILRAIGTVQTLQPPRPINLMDLFAAIARLPMEHSPASRVLADHGLTFQRLEAMNRRSPVTRPLGPPGSASPGTLSPSSPPAPAEVRSAPAREAYLYDLGSLAKGWHDRHHLLDEAMRLLCGARQPGLLLMGPPAVGKESLATELARRLTQGPRPLVLEQTRILGLDLAELVAGVTARGELEERVQRIVKGIETRTTHAQVVLWVGELATCLTYARQGQDVLGLLRPALRRGRIRLMASATPEQLRKVMDHDPALVRHFVQLQVATPSIDDVLAIARQEVETYAEHHGLDYPEPLLRRAVTLLGRYLPTRPLIEGTLHTLDEAGAHAASLGRTELTEADLTVAIARQASVPLHVVTGGDGARIDRIQAHLRTHLVGQDEAATALVNTLRRAAAGLGDGGKSRPLGTFFFAGPTGVGKTEMAKRLAEGMDAPLLCLDMSEYHEAHSTARLIGAPPGYVGYSQGGQLSQPLVQHPRHVVLIDEFEKAHPAVHKLFLQVLDRGVLTDGQGQVVDFRQAVVIFTSNVGAADADRPTVGFLPDTHAADHRREKALEQTFPPELRNRFDRILQFHALTPADMVGVVDRTLKELASQAAERGHRLTFTPGVRTWLAKEGYHPTFGARPLKRLVAERVTQAVADELLRHDGPLRATVGYRQGQIQVRLAP